VHLLGTGGVELAAAFNWYLNDYLNATYDWNTYAEGQLPAALTASAVPELKMPGSGDGTAAAAKAIPLPRPESSPVRPRAVPWSYYMNVCTYGYSLAFVPWEYWVKHIDWMAMQGVNMPLAFVGQEWYDALGLIWL
jgi:alpha-N-acetylglucosaminidase